MKQIYEQTNIVKKMLSNQQIDNCKKYRKFFYVEECHVDEGVLLLNTITYGLVFLSTDEYDSLNNLDLNDPTVRFLIEQYFLVPENFDDKKLASQIINTRLQIQNTYRRVPLNSFVILPTTGCNARCFYCFEKGAKISNMTEQTAHDVADFIKRKGDKIINVTWFGGEPLINQKAIDIICTDLKKFDIKCNSRIITNGYLLDEATINKAIDLWNLKKVQITLDGTEEVYNNVKNYVYKDVSSPFKKVLNNIESALRTDLKVSIRLNMDEHNVEDLFQLSKLLIDKFGKYDNCHIYVVRLFEETSLEIKNRKPEDRHKFIKRSNELQRFIDSNMPPVVMGKLEKSYPVPNQCMACNDAAVLIVPDGHLGKCEHYVDRDFYGSIYSDKIDLKTIARYKERAVVSPNCVDCKYMSLCQPLKCCSGVPNHCDEVDKKNTINRLRSNMKNVYAKFLEVQGKS